ncbi:type VII secretion-associated serine protease mycosin [Streptomyces olivoreticuli]|uniref:type VII secretion-associated serine protease mycosin n=1 Tax=Streptomyces olivoreticuli TaxID=68246 RepID=UPI002657FC90|nr:type VII secretion-associated serine protease mycosin [Streptomyces olivoreticuli]WKK27396.1 type VII secretion-associated serine protease mycosin [Streptomyces olivoreticuli]
MQAEQMWKVSKGEGVTVAVIDTGVDGSLPELRGRVLEGTDASNRSTDPHVDSGGHGTNMATLIAGSGADGGIQGLAPEAKILPIKTVPDQRVDAVDDLMGRAIRYAADHDAKVINISEGPLGVLENFPKMQSAVNYALGKGSLIFASTGNDGDKANEPAFPAALPGVVGVGAIDRQGKVAKFSTYGNQVGLVAFGDEIVQHCEKGPGYCIAGGTSQATAIASASAALIWAKHPDWTNNQVLRVMMDTAGKPAGAKMPSKYLGYGSVRPRKVLVDGEGDPGPADVNPLLAANAPKPSASDSDPNSSAAGKPIAAATATDDGIGTITWVALSAGAAVIIAAAIGFGVMRRRAKATYPTQP